MKSDRNQISRLLTFLFSLILLVGCNTGKGDRKFECYEYYLPKDINWKVAYDDVKFSTDAMLLRDKSSRWAIIFPGSMTLNSDTIYINQEEGYPNQCHLIGKLKPGHNSVLSKNISLNLINDSEVIYDGRRYAKIKNQVNYGCWCDWDQKIIKQNTML